MVIQECQRRQSPRETPEGFSRHLGGMRVCWGAQASSSYRPGSFLEEEISLAAPLAERQGVTEFCRGESFEAAACFSQEQPSEPEWECPGRRRASAGREGACGLPLAEGKGAVWGGGRSGSQGPKANMLEMFCNRIPQEN